MMASMGVSLSLHSKVGALLSFGCLVWIMLCRPQDLNMDVSSPLRTSSLASRPMMRCPHASIQLRTAFLRSSRSIYISTKLCPPVLTKGTSNQYSCFAERPSIGKTQHPKGCCMELGNWSIKTNWGQPTARVCLCCSKDPTRVFS